MYINIPYAESDAMQKIDLYVPKKKDFPTILYIHEGILLGGDKSDSPYSVISNKFKNARVAFSSMNYRLGPNNKWPAQPDDVVSAFVWLKKYTRIRRQQ